MELPINAEGWYLRRWRGSLPEIWNLLQPEQNPSLVPELFQAVIIALFRREEVDNDIPQIDHQPSRRGYTLNPAVQAVVLFCAVADRISEAVEHAFACSCANHKKIGEGCNPADIDQEDILALFIFK